MEKNSIIGISRKTLEFHPKGNRILIGSKSYDFMRYEGLKGGENEKYPLLVACCPKKYHRNSRNIEFHSVLNHLFEPIVPWPLYIIKHL